MGSCGAAGGGFAVIVAMLHGKKSLMVACFLAWASTLVMFITFWVALVSLNKDKFPGYGEFFLHPTLMTLGFGVFGSLATISFRTFRDVMGFEHFSAKMIHAGLHLAAIITGSTGVASMWKTHSTVAHFQSLHSMIGIGALSFYGLQFVTAAYVFNWGSTELRKNFLEFHKFAGMVLFVLNEGTIVSGVLSFVYRGKPAGTFTSDQQTMNVAAFLTLVQAICMSAVLCIPASSPAECAEDCKESVPLIEEKIPESEANEDSSKDPEAPPHQAASYRAMDDAEKNKATDKNEASQQAESP